MFLPRLDFNPRFDYFSYNFVLKLKKIVFSNHFTIFNRRDKQTKDIFLPRTHRKSRNAC